MADLRLESTGDFPRFARALKQADKSLGREVRNSLRKVAKPLGEQVMPDAAARMPHRGGFSALVAQPRIGLRVNGSGVVLLLGDRSRHDIRSLEQGRLRHPVFADGSKTRREWPWVSQRVPEHAFTNAFLRLSPPRARAAALRAVQEVLARAGAST